MIQQTNNKAIEEIIAAHTAATSAAMRLADAYQAFFTEQGGLVADSRSAILTTTAEAPAPEPPAPKPAKPSRARASKRASQRRSSAKAPTPAPDTDIPREKLKMGAVFWVGTRKAKFSRLARGSDGAESMVDFMDGSKERAKVRTSELRLEPAAETPKPADPTPPSPTTPETKKSDTPTGGSDPDNPLVLVHNAFLTLAPSKEKPVTAHQVAELTGQSVASVLSAQLQLNEAKLLMLNAQGRVVRVLPGVVPAAKVEAPTNKVAARAQAKLEELEEGSGERTS